MRQLLLGLLVTMMFLVGGALVMAFVPPGPDSGGDFFRAVMAILLLFSSGVGCGVLCTLSSLKRAHEN